MFKKRGRKKRDDGFDNTRFISEEAEQRYELTIKHKALVPERGFQNPGGQTEKIITDRGWHYFSKQPPIACIPIVREFYANAHEHRNFTVFVRGKWIPFDKGVINRAYRLDDIPFDQYSSFSEGEVDWDNVIQALCKPDSGIAWRRHDGKPVNFHSGGLTSEAKAWHYFISGKLMPTMNTSEVTKDRACLNYCIHAGLSIDVGSIIHNSILQYIKSTTVVSTSGLGHPSLIDALCNAYGVCGSHDEETLNPRAVLTKQKICSYTSRILQFDSAEGTSSQTRTPLSRQKSGSISEQVGRLNDKMNKMMNAQKEQEKRIARVERKVESIKHAVDHNQDQHLTFFEYMGEFNSAMTQTLSNCNLNIGPRHVDFPDPPSYHYYSYPQEEEEEEEEEQEEDDGEEGSE